MIMVVPALTVKHDYSYIKICKVMLIAFYYLFKLNVKSDVLYPGTSALRLLKSLSSSRSSEIVVIDIDIVP